MLTENDFPHYYICDVCAKEKGGKWPKGHVATVHVGTCEYCKEERAIVAPYVDYSWPSACPVFQMNCKIGRD